MNLREQLLKHMFDNNTIWYGIVKTPSNKLYRFMNIKNTHSNNRLPFQYHENLIDKEDMK